jgi:FtsZ-interacting cell division protein ZipA
VIDFSTLDSLIILVGVITVPALVVFGVLTYLRVRNSKFRHKHRARRHSGDDE